LVAHEQSHPLAEVIMGQLLKHTPRARQEFITAGRRRSCSVAPIECLQRPRGESPTIYATA
jgi:hypothetical protein